jgi:hypothetical protein
MFSKRKYKLLIGLHHKSNISTVMLILIQAVITNFAKSLITFSVLVRRADSNFTYSPVLPDYKFCQIIIFIPFWFDIGQQFNLFNRIAS